MKAIILAILSGFATLRAAEPNVPEIRVATPIEVYLTKVTYRQNGFSVRRHNMPCQFSDVIEGYLRDDPLKKISLVVARRMRPENLPIESLTVVTVKEDLDRQAGESPSPVILYALDLKDVVYTKEK